MENARFQPYEGQEPYIFASYSHRDSETVLPILDALNKRGFRVWYDEGIPWTAEWKDGLSLFGVGSRWRCSQISHKKSGLI